LVTSIFKASEDKGAACAESPNEAVTAKAAARIAYFINYSLVDILLTAASGRWAQAQFRLSIKGAMWTCVHGLPKTPRRQKASSADLAASGKLDHRISKRRGGLHPSAAAKHTLQKRRAGNGCTFQPSSEPPACARAGRCAFLGQSYPQFYPSYFNGL
jgi:hypothetical protein